LSIQLLERNSNSPQFTTFFVDPELRRAEAEGLVKHEGSGEQAVYSLTLRGEESLRQEERQQAKWRQDIAVSAVLGSAIVAVTAVVIALILHIEDPAVKVRRAATTS
jgi:DNA-binding PadR family transcriptional regulator